MFWGIDMESFVPLPYKYQYDNMIMYEFRYDHQNIQYRIIQAKEHVYCHWDKNEQDNDLTKRYYLTFKNRIHVTYAINNNSNFAIYINNATVNNQNNV